MTEQLVLDLTARHCLTSQLVLDVGYDIDNLKGEMAARYAGPVHIDSYGRRVPSPAHGSINLGEPTSSIRLFMAAMGKLFDRVADARLLVRRLTVTAAGLMTEYQYEQEKNKPQEMDLFADPAAEERRERMRHKASKERSLQQTVLALKEKYGKNSILRGMNFQPGATAIERNGQVGGHRAQDVNY